MRCSLAGLEITRTQAGVSRAFRRRRRWNPFLGTYSSSHKRSSKHITSNVFTTQLKNGADHKKEKKNHDLFHTLTKCAERILYLYLPIYRGVTLEIGK